MVLICWPVQEAFDRAAEAEKANKPEAAIKLYRTGAEAAAEGLSLQARGFGAWCYVTSLHPHMHAARAEEHTSMALRDAASRVLLARSRLAGGGDLP